MPRISNVTTHGIEDSIIASGYPMRLETPENIKEEIRDTPEFPGKRAIQLAHTPAGSGHDQFLTGMIAQFDLG